MNNKKDFIWIVNRQLKGGGFKPVGKIIWELNYYYLPFKKGYERLVFMHLDNYEKLKTL